MKIAKVFDILKNISNSKTDISKEDGFKEVYSQFVINRGMSFYPDTVLFANEMNNSNYNIPDEFHYLFYHHVTHKKHRPYVAWPKNLVSDNDSLNVVKEYYNCNDEKARDILELLDNKVVEKIKKSYGGIRK